MSQLIELLWRNRAYTEGIADPAVNYENRKGAMFAGFKTEMGFDNDTRKPQKRTRHEYLNYDRCLVFPGKLEDSTNSYHIGPTNGQDPASLDLPSSMQMPRTIATEIYDSGKQLTAASIQNWHTKPEEGSGPGIVDPSKYGVKPDDTHGTPEHMLKPGMMVRQRARYADDGNDPVAEKYAVAGFINDIDYGNAGDCTVSIDLAESIAGVSCVLKKVVVQFSKVDHHISEFTLDFSDITRGSGSISSSENPQSNLLTILLDGKEKLHTSYFDCKMGKFGASKFKLGVRNVHYFPPLSCEAGGFDSGSQVATATSMTFNCEKSYEGAMTTEAGSSLDVAPQFARSPNQAWPNPLRGVPEEGCGATLVADAINQGYDMIGKAADGTGDATSADHTSSTTPQPNTSDLNDNKTTTSAGKEITSVAQVCWRRAGCSSYTVQPRKTRGTILAVNVTLQADAGYG